MPRRAAALVAAAAVLWACIAEPAPPPPSASSSAAPTTQAPPASDPVPAESSLATPWTLQLVGSAERAVTVAAVESVPDGFVVVGGMGQAGKVPLALHSGDGTTWDAELIDGGDIVPSELVPWRDGLVAVGSGETSRCGHPFGMATWTRTPADAFWAGPARDEDLCAGGNPVALVSGDRPWLIGSGTGDVPFALASDDGLAWTNHGAALGDVRVSTAATDGTSLWVVVRRPDDREQLLRSADGDRWDLEPAPPAGLESACVIDGRLIVVRTREGTAQLLRGELDGGWVALPLDGLPPGAQVRLVRLADSVVALIAAEDVPPAIAVSRDGSVWRPIERPVKLTPASRLLDVAVHDGVAVLIGAVDGPGFPIGAVWSAPASLLEP